MPPPPRGGVDLWQVAGAVVFDVGVVIVVFVVVFLIAIVVLLIAVIVLLVVIVVLPVFATFVIVIGIGMRTAA